MEMDVAFIRGMGIWTFRCLIHCPWVERLSDEGESRRWLLAEGGAPDSPRIRSKGPTATDRHPRIVLQRRTSCAKQAQEAQAIRKKRPLSRNLGK